MNYTIANAKNNMLSKPEKDNKYELGGYVIDLNEKNDSHSILVNNALGSKKILDVGCGKGYMGTKIKELQRCTVDGIEIDKVAAKIAKKTYDQVFVMALGDQHDKNFRAFLENKEKYDCIICGDLIEHLADPGYILSILINKLARGGKLLVSIPNIAHANVIAGLVDGIFNYNMWGILDTTHLRFWTENSFYEFIANVNELYNLKMAPKIIAKTTAFDGSVDNSLLEEVCGKDIYTLQNIFEITIGKKKYTPKRRSTNNYSNLIRIGNSNTNLQNGIIQRDKIIYDMENSLSWKITKPLRKINAIFKKK
ncbi:class I SAM-dependent methyltransferase [Candidatus Saccharibacteria bacterium]|nr:class I SAM-dependent methyltransferase [Candidatus Saccharibacteria bacterium]